MVWLSVLRALLLIGGSDGARILWFQPALSKSHSSVGKPLIEELARRGHNVTSVTNFPHKNQIPNLRELDISHKIPPNYNYLPFQVVEEFMNFPHTAPHAMLDVEMTLCEQALSQPDILRLLHSNESFDLVITESFTTDCFVPLAYQFKAPLITLVTSSALPWVSDRMGLPDNPAYIPNYFLGFLSKMTLLEKTYNSIGLLYTKIFHRYYALPRAETFVKSHFGNSLPLLDQLIKNTSMMFLNSHFSLSISRPFPPNVVEIGGIHIKTNLQPLPQDLQDVLDRSAEGVILVSFGSVMRTATMHQRVIRMFLDAFSKLPQTFIFKYEEHLQHIPPNVIVRKWVPQQQILEHKNLRLLVTHGGQVTIIEATHFAVPIVGIPIFADQALNVEGMVQRGSGIKLEFNYLSQQKIEAAITEVLTNLSYAENVKRLSQQFRDRPMTPLQTAVYWTEYVIRHQGAPDLQPASVHLPLYQYLLLDVLAVLLLPLFYIIHRLFRLYHVFPINYRYCKTKKNE